MNFSSLGIIYRSCDPSSTVLLSLSTYSVQGRNHHISIKFIFPGLTTIFRAVKKVNASRGGCLRCPVQDSAEGDFDRVMSRGRRLMVIGQEMKRRRDIIEEGTIDDIRNNIIISRGLFK